MNWISFIFLSFPSVQIRLLSVSARGIRLTSLCPLTDALAVPLPTLKTTLLLLKRAGLALSHRTAVTCLRMM